MLKFILALVFILSPLSLANTALALPQIIPQACLDDGDKCELCHLTGLISNIMEFLIAFGVLFGVVMVAVAGFQLVLSGGNESAKEQAKTRIMNIVWGFLIILIAYLAVSTVLSVLSGKSLSEWGETLECVPQNPLRSSTAGSNQTAGTNSSGVQVSSGGAACANCTAVSSLPIKQGACAGQAASGCQVNGALAGKLGTMDGALKAENVDWQITEAYPPTVNHQNSCHSAGTCVDANCVGSCDATEIKSFISAAQGAGLKPVYEVRTQGEYDSLRATGIPAAQLDVEPQITGPHFSVYNI